MIFNIFHCKPSDTGGWSCKCISSSTDDPTTYLGEPINMTPWEVNTSWFLMDDLSMLKLKVVEL